MASIIALRQPTRADVTNSDGKVSTEWERYFNQLVTTAWVDYDVAWTNTGTANVLGNGTLTGRYHYTGPTTIEIYIRLIMGTTTTSGNGQFVFSMPTSAAQYTVFPGYGYHAGAYAGFIGSAPATDTFGVINVSTGTFVTATVPWTWGSADEFYLQGSYEVGTT